MRKTNVFGHKINQSRFLYLIFAVFILVLIGYFTIGQVQSKKLEKLEAEQILIQTQIDDFLESSQSQTYHEISQIIQYLPNSYNRLSITNEIEFVKNLAGLTLASNYALVFDESATSPFNEPLPDSIKFTEVLVSMRTDDPALILDFMDLLLEQDRIYYIDQLNVTYTVNEEAIVQMTIYTFYNDVSLA